MRIYNHANVLEAAQQRIAWLFDEFENVVVHCSGGKDSTVVLNLALAEAERRGRLPLPVMWLDQEMEWQATADMVQAVMEDPRVEPRWFQIPFQMPNSTSAEAWIKIWDADRPDLWMRPKWARAYTENIFGPGEDFYSLFQAIRRHFYPDSSCATIGGVRAEESPGRAAGLTSFPTYKWVTWGTKEDPKRGHYNFYPIYDWTYRDVWKAIHSHGWPYCRIYDQMYQYGYHIQDMRVSNLHHETAVKHLRFMQEIEPVTWEKLTRRMKGINTVKQLKQLASQTPKELPWMFSDWKEYRDFLPPRLVHDPSTQHNLAKTFAAFDKKYVDMKRPDLRHKVEVASILTQDGDVMTKMKNWEISPPVGTWRKWKRGDAIRPEFLRTNPYING